ncbi:MAG: nucleotidyltransferase domain-containing protein [Candidatus Thorarchaeota archaeon]|nr:nucleotidyltransferase domain-containing protein [Candidatus Thorarchaeota archaeon]
MVEQVISRIKKELDWIQEIDKADAVLLFGSQIEGTATERSDYDICVVASTIQSADEQAALLGKIWRRIDADKFDVWLFEELPLFLQITVIENHEVLFCADIPELYEYFYRFRKQWSTQASRQSLTFEVGIDPMKQKEIWKSEPKSI